MVGIRFCALLLGLVVLATGAATAQECRSATIAGNPEWAPFSVTGADGKLAGAGYDIARLALARLGIETRIGEAEPWSRALTSLEAGRTDLIVSAYWNAERATKFLYTEPYADDPIVVFTKATARFPVAGLGDLDGRSGVVALGSNFGDAITGFIRDNPHITVNASKEGMFRQLLSTRVDYAILSRRNGERVLAQLGLTEAITAAPHPLAVNAVHMMLSRQSPCAGRIAALNDALAELRSAGTIARLIAEADGS
jgi:polar amino acid transport system substrate-binding protein